MRKYFLPTLSLAVFSTGHCFGFGDSPWNPGGLPQGNHSGSDLCDGISPWIGSAGIFAEYVFDAVFGVYLQWFPVAGYAGIADGLGEHLRYLFLPALSLGIVQAAYLTRMTRSSLLETLYKNYIQTARAKGLKEKKVVMKYALKNGAPVILTAIGQSFGSLITGTIVTETLFNIPGLGMLTLTSINRRDVFVIQGVVLFVTLLYVLVNLVVDILYGFTDPRLRPGRR